MIALGWPCLLLYDVSVALSASIPYVCFSDSDHCVKAITCFTIMPMHMIPGIGGLITALLLLVACSFAAWFTSDDSLYTFESRGHGSFEPRLANYAKITETMIGLATGSIVLLAGSAVVRSGGQ